MKFEKKPFGEIPQFSKKDTAYQCEDPAYRPFFKFSTTIDGFKSAMDERQKFPVDRSLLVNEIQKAYTKIGMSSQQEKNLQNLLSEDGFTVITAHQPSLFTGPLYYVLKIFSVINLAERLNKEWPEKKIVPVFVSGGEDHDFEEINHTEIYGNTVTWTTQEKGSVGRMSLEGLNASIATLFDIIGEGDNAMKIKDIVNASFESAETYAQFTFALVNKLFNKYGLLMVNMDNPNFKRRFIPVIKEELIDQPSKELVENTQAALDEVGFSSQAFPRDINLFYLGDGYRERIEYQDGRYHILNQNLTFSKEEIIRELEAYPERFSPNVVIRPLYQEFIFPNLAYIGGGGEIAYWLERKNQFQHFNIFFPLLLRRNSAAVVTSGQAKTINKLGLKIDDLFEDTDAVINKYLDIQSTVDLHLDQEKAKVEKIYQELSERAFQIDPSLKKYVLAESVKQVKTLEHIESRLKRSLKQQEDVNINKIRNIREKLFPSNGLQERKDNFFQFYNTYGDAFLDILKEGLDPLDKSFTIFYV